MIATDLDTGEEVVLARGPLKPALLASAALPGVFPIVHHDGRRLVDGGVVTTCRCGTRCRARSTASSC